MLEPHYGGGDLPRFSSSRTFQLRRFLPPLKPESFVETMWFPFFKCFNKLRNHVVLSKPLTQSVSPLKPFEKMTERVLHFFIAVVNPFSLLFNFFFKQIVFSFRTFQRNLGFYFRAKCDINLFFLPNPYTTPFSRHWGTTAAAEAGQSREANGSQTVRQNPLQEPTLPHPRHRNHNRHPGRAKEIQAALHRLKPRWYSPPAARKPTESARTRRNRWYCR